MALRQLFKDDQPRRISDGPNTFAVPLPYYLTNSTGEPQSHTPNDDQIFMRVRNESGGADIGLNDLYDWAQYPAEAPGMTLPGRTPPKRDVRANGTLGTANENKVALFRYGKQVYATDFKCPHLGGPLHMGEIETLPDRSLCVRCPWHGWRFNLQTGKCITSTDAGGCNQNTRVATYSVRVDSQNDNKLSVGFKKLNPQYFAEPSF